MLGLEECKPKKPYRCTPVKKETKSHSQKYDFVEPFWWKGSDEQAQSEDDKYVCLEHQDLKNITDDGMPRRWKPLVGLTDFQNKDACERRILMNR